MAVQTLPVNIDLTIFAGTTFRRVFRWLPAGAPQDFSGWGASFRVGPTGGAATLTLTEADGVILGADGTFTVEIDAASTATMNPGIYTYVLDLTEVYGDVTRLLRGKVTVVLDLEHP